MTDAGRTHRLIVPCLLGGVFLWAYWPTLVEIGERWSSDPQYSHGYLVPLFALYLLWQRRGQITSADLRPGWFGPLLVVGGAALHLLGAYLYFDWVSGASVLPVLAGLAVSFGGRKALAWSW